MRTWLYVSGVLFSLQSLSLRGRQLHDHPTIAYLLQINPAAVYITLVRYALLEKYREAMPGAKPYNSAEVQAVPGLPGQVHELQRLLPSEHPAEHPHPVDIRRWLGGVVVVIGFLFFWRAEARYGRG